MARATPLSPQSVRHEPVISSDPRRQFGNPCIAGSRITAETIAEMHWAGDGVAELTDAYGIDRLDVLWCCAWYVREGLLGSRRGKRRVLWHLWSEHAIWFLGGWDKVTAELCDPDDYEAAVDPYRQKVEAGKRAAS